MPGELLVAFHRRDQAAVDLAEDLARGKVEHVTRVESMQERLLRAGITEPPGFPLELLRLRVPAGNEQWKMNLLHALYVWKVRDLGSSSWGPESTEDAFSVTTNHWVRAAAGRPLAGQFVFSASHDHALGAMGVGSVPPPSPALADVRVAVVDSGIADDFPDPPQVRRNFVHWRPDPERFAAGAVVPDDRVPDEIGHGTLVALLIRSVAPTVRLIVHKVVDGSGRGSEWDTEAALFASTDTDVLNLSIELGVGDSECPHCGRRSSGSTRSHVFETLLGRLYGPESRTVVVAAAGNGGRSELSYPARFAGVVAVGAVNSGNALSGFSNHGGRDQYGEPHPNYYVMFGGERPPLGQEVIGTFGTPERRWVGTSFAAAYASGVVARVRARIVSVPGPTQASSVLEILRTSADTKRIPGYDPARHGRGMLHL